MAIIQVLPEWLWERSALGLAESVLLRSSAPGVPNSKLTMTALDLLDDDVLKGLKVPVLTLEPESLGTWARMVAGAGDAQIKGFLFAPSSTTLDDSSALTETSTTSLSAKQRLQRFRLSASPMARRLAGLLAAAPISLPVVRLIQQTMLPESRQVHVAEVFLGGILKPLLPIDADTDPDSIQYDFIDEVRDLLLDSVPLPKSVEVLREVSKYVTERAGLSISDFTAVLADPTLPINGATGDLQVRPFARLTAQVLKRLGGRYTELAEQLEQRVESSSVISQKLELPKLDLPRFYRACNPSKALIVGEVEDRQYYIDFSSVRGSKIIESLKRRITLLSPDEPTCQLFTGHIGCGKSTELLRLKSELEKEGFHVVYFGSSQDLDMADVDITDILLSIARQVSESLESIRIRLKPSYFTNLFTEIVESLQIPIELEAQAELSVGIGKITAKTKDNPKLRRQLREYLEPRMAVILESINKELLERATTELKGRGNAGLVVIVDNLDRVDIRPLPSGRTQPEYLFIDRGKELRKLNCHIVYTIPLALIFSNDVETLIKRLGGGIPPKVLPMVPVRRRGGEEFQEGMELLRRMVMVRAFPYETHEKQLVLTTQVFDTPETLDRLCRVSGGHVRNLLGLLFDCLRENNPPISRECLEGVIRSRRDYLTSSIDDEEWELLFQVVQYQTVRGDVEYQTLLRSMFVFEYRDREGTWFGINPALEEAQKFQLWLKHSDQKISPPTTNRR
jgi:hypothetical protein